MRRIVKQQTSKEDLQAFNANQFVLDNFLFDKQLAFVRDPEPFKVAVCSRRSGKTVACAAHLIHTAMSTPDCTCLYITLSSVSGKRIIWKEFKKIFKNYGLKASVNDLELSLTFANGSTIYVVGAKDASEIEKFRGLPIKLCYIDECQSFREYIKDLIDDVIAPALMDYAGSLCLIGTPGAVPTGYFHECAVKSDVWSKHHWTFWENPFIPITSKMTHQQVFDREMRRRGVSIDHPSVKREWFGKWETDNDSLVYHYKEEQNHYDELPILPNNQKYNYILGIDIGYKDADALAVLAWSEASKNTYLIEEVVTHKQGITELVQQIQLLEKKYDISKMVMDMGGLGKKIGEEIIKRYLIPVEAAEKSRKMENIELLNDSLRTGRFKAKRNSKFAEDSYLMEIDRDKSTPERIVVSNRYHSDIIDAVLYAFKCSYAFSFEPLIKAPQYGSKEWAEQQSQGMWEAELEGFKAENDFKARLYGESE